MNLLTILVLYVVMVTGVSHLVLVLETKPPVEEHRRRLVTEDDKVIRVGVYSVPLKPFPSPGDLVYSHDLERVVGEVVSVRHENPLWFLFPFQTKVLSVEVVGEVDPEGPTVGIHSEGKGGLLLKLMSSSQLSS